ncbi:Major intrinsic protein [Parasponia andersonii]|uniref:Major intrinsic protein n=1 Tax=Parasponia andersonii TaxID=3476 RepID=A0A2P5C5H8_PARAD|nr:Major intrinsic protein [Parasponia andersonii]
MARTSLAARFEQSISLNALRSYIAEFISTFFYVFAVVGSTMSSRDLVVIATTNAFALASAVFIAANISGGHVNPAVTFGMAVGGHISVPTALFYWISQLLASIIACVVLKVTIIGQV